MEFQSFQKVHLSNLASYISGWVYVNHYTRFYSHNAMWITSGREIFPNWKIPRLIYKVDVKMRENWEDYPIQDLKEYGLDMDSLLNVTHFNRNFVFSLNTFDITL